MVLKLNDGTKVTGRTLVIANGARYRRPRINGLTRFEGRGIWYWASPVEAAMCADQDVILVGGGNSAGQAAVYLAGHVRSVTMMVRARGLAVSMSRYLIDRIAPLPKITLFTETQITALEGEADLETVRWTGPDGEDQAPIRHVFLFAGADPASDWLSDCGVALDAHGFVLTGQDGAPSLQTTRSGVLAIGDVRSGSVKRVGGAIGEGAAVVAQIHALLGDAPPGVSATARGPLS